jgi:alkaline phosphatase
MHNVNWTRIEQGGATVEEPVLWKRKTAFLLVFFLIVSGCYQATYHQRQDEPHPKAKTIIFMIPDGMGLADVTAARIFQNGPDGKSLSMETLPTIGYQRTHSADSSVTDSAAAASAWASGEKYRNGEISCHDDDQDNTCEPTPPGPTILEIAQAKGKSTALVATSAVTHATPAAFGAPVPSRHFQNEIARQYVQVTEVDVILGGGMEKFTSTRDKADACGTFGNFIPDAKNSGYEIVFTQHQLEKAVAGGAKKLLGLFTAEGKAPELFRLFPETPYPPNEPTLPQMTKAALAILEKDRDGFFLLVEGSQIDWANHRNSVCYQLSETLAFDSAVQVVLDWLNEEPSRKRTTLLIIAPDHETGGFAILGAEASNYKCGDVVKDAWATHGHTAADVVFWSQGPGSQKLGKAIDNTDVYKVMLKVLE